jgi:putative Mg2+ transporter-C (MgtC) family protein
MQTLTLIEFFTRLAVGLGCGADRRRAAMARPNGGLADQRPGRRRRHLVRAVLRRRRGSAKSTQVAAYVVSGIEFLGGGVILRDGFHVRGLNTAATMWCSAAVGVLAASGHLAFAATGTDDGTETRLTARLLLAGDAATRLEQLVSRLSLEPGIHAVRWHAAYHPGPLPAPAPAPAADAAGPGGQG